MGGLGALLVLGGILGLDLVGLAGEDDQASLVGLEALDIGGEALLREILTAGIDGNTDGGSVKLGDTSSLTEMLEMAPDLLETIFRTLSSAMVKPRPRRVRRLYLTVLQKKG